MSYTIRSYLGALTGALLVAGASGTAADSVALQGAAPGRWTMDLDAAVSMARQKQLPMLLNFTGSDWCGWCKLMDKNVFSQKAWSEYAAGHLLLVWIDAPQDLSLVPSYFVARNAELAQRYAVTGFPTFIILDADGKTVLGRLGATEETSPKFFIEQVERVCRYRPASIDAFTKGLAPAEAQAYRKLVGETVAARAKLQPLPSNAPPDTSPAAQAAARLEEAVEICHIDAKAKALGPENGTLYRKLRMDLLAAQRDFEAWLVTKPTGTPENVKIFQAYQGRLKALRADIDKF